MAWLFWMKWKQRVHQCSAEKLTLSPRTSHYVKASRKSKSMICLSCPKDGYHDESVDFIFLRHALEHSPYPIFSLMEYNRVLKQGGKFTLKYRLQL